MSVLIRDMQALYKAYHQSREVWSPKEMLLGNDRRAFWRVACDLECKIESRLFGVELVARVVNVSVGGLGVIAPVSWPEGSQISVALNEGRLKTEAIVCFRMEATPQYYFGVKFRELDVKCLWQIRKLVRQTYRGSLLVGS